MSRFSLRHALFISGLLLVSALLVLVTPALAGHAPETTPARPIAAPQVMPTAPVPPATVHFAVDPIRCRYDVGDVFTVTVQLANLTGFYGGQLKMDFDATNFQVLDTDPVRPFVQVMPGSLLPPGSFVAPLDSNQVNNTTGKILFGGVRLASGPTDGTGSLVLIPFQVTGTAGSMNLTVPPVVIDLANDQSQPLPVTSDAPTTIPLGPGRCVYLPHLSVAHD